MSCCDGGCSGSCLELLFLLSVMSAVVVAVSGETCSCACCIVLLAWVSSSSCRELGGPSGGMQAGNESIFEEKCTKVGQSTFFFFSPLRLFRLFLPFGTSSSSRAN